MSEFNMKPKQSNNKKQLLPFVSPFLSPGFQRPQEDSEMDWSMDTPQAPASPLPHVPPTSEHIPLPHVPLHNMGSNGKNRAEPAVLFVLDYSEGQPAVASTWDGAHHALSIFGTGDMVLKDSELMFKSIRRMRNYIKHHPVDKVTIGREFTLVIKQLWKLFDNIYAAKWDSLIFNREKTLTIRKCVGECIVPFYRQNQPSTSTLNTKSNISAPLLSTEDTLPTTTNMLAAPPPPNKNIESTIKKDPKPSNMKKFYAQASKSNLSHIKDIVQVKEAFPALLVDEVGKVLKIKNSREGNKKLRINMMTREPSRKEVIILMAKHIAKLIINSAHIHIASINKCLKNSKLDIITDFIQSTNNRIIITTNKPANDLNLSTIEKYLKNIQNIDPDSIESPRLPKSKLYMKIIGLPYKINQNIISSDFIEGVLKEILLFNSVTLALKPCVIKASPKSDMAVVWLDIWDSQSGSLAKNIINHRFNIRRFIATVKDTNMNPGVPQCKNCWKWGYLTLSYCSHISRCAKCYGAHTTKHHREKAWCYMENKKTNQMATKEGELCSHVFKYMNCKDDHQADSYSCPYWHNCFNRD